VFINNIAETRKVKAALVKSPRRKKLKIKNSNPTIAGRMRIRVPVKE
jgi:hypothetical protein